MRLPFSSIRAAAAPDPAGVAPTIAFVAVAVGMLGILVLHRVAGWPLSPLTWYLARASGLTLYLLLWLATVTGLGLTTKLLDRFGGRGLVYSLHGYATRLGFALLALHGMSLAADATVPFTLRDLTIPFASSVREPWVGLGVLAGEIGALIALSAALWRLTGYRFWRVLHALTLPAYALALAHGLGAGTDARTGWALSLYASTGAAVVLLCCYRFLRRGRRGLAVPPARDAPFDRLQPSSKREQRWPRPQAAQAATPAAMADAVAAPRPTWHPPRRNMKPDAFARPMRPPVWIDPHLILDPDVRDVLCGDDP